MTSFCDFFVGMVLFYKTFIHSKFTCIFITFCNTALRQNSATPQSKRTEIILPANTLLTKLCTLTEENESVVGEDYDKNDDVKSGELNNVDNGNGDKVEDAGSSMENL